MRYAVFGLLAICVVSMAIVPLSAHHAIAAKFDTNKTVKISGVVTGVDWANPHVHIFINVKEGGALNIWAAELESPVDLQKAGWNRETLKPGDSITVEGLASRDGSKQTWAKSVTLAGGKKVFDIPAATQTARNQP